MTHTTASLTTHALLMMTVHTVALGMVSSTRPPPTLYHLGPCDFKLGTNDITDNSAVTTVTAS